MSKNLLLEIGTEEMPANIMSGVVNQLRELVDMKLKEARISFEKTEVYATPRRLAVIVKQAADAQPDEEVKKRGPSVKAAFDENGNPTYDVHFNPNGSVCAIEGITSPDGRVFGKMGHSERVGNGLYKNVEGNFDIGMFRAAVKFFR